MSADKAIDWIQNVLVKKIMDKMELGDGSTVKDCNVTELDSQKDNWASVIFSLKFAVQRADKKEDVDVLVKLMDENETVRHTMQSDGKFSNECFLYSKFVPTVASLIKSFVIRQQIESLFPKCYYAAYAGKSSPPLMHDGVVVVENLKPLGYELGNRESLDFEHLMLAVECLGSFHAMSWFMKERHRETFYKEFVPAITETMFVPELEADMTVGYGTMNQRALQALRDELPNDDAGLRRLTELTGDMAGYRRKMVVPKEPLAVLCHGDFLRNNVLFRYDTSGKPDAMRIVDFQTVRYASPVIDLSVILYMNSTHEVRAKHMSTLIRNYHRSAVRTLADLLEEDETRVEERYSFDVFLEEFREYAMHGYFIAVSFLPWMLADKQELADGTQLWRDGTPVEEFCNKTANLGGERATRVMAQMAKDFIDFALV